MKIGSLRCCFGEFFFKKGTTFLLSSYAPKICVDVYVWYAHICMYVLYTLCIYSAYIMHYNLFTHYKWVLIIYLYKICMYLYSCQCMYAYLCCYMFVYVYSSGHSNISA